MLFECYNGEAGFGHSADVVAQWPMDTDEGHDHAVSLKPVFIAPRLQVRPRHPERVGMQSGVVLCSTEGMHYRDAERATCSQYAPSLRDCAAEVVDVVQRHRCHNKSEHT